MQINFLAYCSRLKDKFGSNPIIAETAEKYVTLILSFASFYILSTYLGPFNFGIYSYLLAVTSLFSSISNLGVRQFLLVRSSKGKTKSLTISNAFALELVGSLALIIALVLYSIAFREFQFIWFYLCFGVINALLSAGIYESHLVGVGKGQIPAKWNLARSLSSSIIVTICAILRFPLSVLVPLTIIPAAIFCCIAFKDGNQYIAISQSNISFRFAAKVFRKSRPYLITLVSAGVYVNTDQIMLRFFDDYNSVGSYSIAAKIFAAFLVVNMVIGRNSYNRLESLAFLRKFFGIMIFLMISMFSFGAFVFPWIYGTTFSAARYSILVLSLGIIPFAAGSLTARWFEHNNLMRAQNKRIVLAALFNVIFNYFLIPSYGAIGASLATLLSFVLQYLMAPLFCPRFIPIFKYQLKALARPCLDPLKLLKNAKSF